MSPNPCVCCGGEDFDRDQQWWSLRGYFGLSGRFCSQCYEKVSHNSYGEPNHPSDYLLIRMKLSAT